MFLPLKKAFVYLCPLLVSNSSRVSWVLESNQINDPVFALDVYTNVASDHFRLGDIDRAISYYHKAIDTLSGMNRDSKSFAEKYMEIGQQYKNAGKALMAREYLMRSLAVYEMRDQQRVVGLTHQRLGKALERQNDLDVAEREFRQTIAIEEELEDDVAASLCHTSLAALLVKRGDTAAAEAEAQAALDAAGRSGDAQTQGQALITLAQLKHNAQDYAGADELFTEALRLLDESNAHELAGVAYSRYANLLEQRGEVQRSLAAFKKAYQHQLQGHRGEGE